MGLAHMLGPDIDVLLDDRFTADHCFELRGTRGANKHEVGLSFTPVQIRPGIADLQGTIWVDTAAIVLTEIEFGYSQIKSKVAGVDPGGSLIFLSLPNGVTLIDRWLIRAPDITVSESINGSLGSGAPFAGRAGLLTQYRESGGAVRQLRWSDGTTWQAPSVVLSATVTADPKRLAAGAFVWLGGTDFGAHADSAGSVTIDSIIPGNYTVEAAEARFANTGFHQTIHPPLVTMGRGDTTHAKLALQPAEDVAARLCHEGFDKNHGALVARVIRPDQGNPPAKAKVSVTTADGLTLGNLHVVQLPYPGAMLLCQLPLEQELRVRVISDTLSDERSVVIPKALKVDTLTAVLHRSSSGRGGR